MLSLINYLIWMNFRELHFPHRVTLRKPFPAQTINRIAYATARRKVIRLLPRCLLTVFCWMDVVRRRLKLLVIQNSINRDNKSTSLRGGGRVWTGNEIQNKHQAKCVSYIVQEVFPWQRRSLSLVQGTDATGLCTDQVSGMDGWRIPGEDE